MRKTVPRALATLSVLMLATGVLMLTSAAATAATRVNAQTSPSASASPSPSPSGSSSPGVGILPTSSASPSASPTASSTSEPNTTSNNDSSVLGQTIPKTGAGNALPLLIGGVILAATSLVVRRVLAHRA
jgi:LPXTG-motif cell wall-anchored protein